MGKISNSILQGTRQRDNSVNSTSTSEDSRKRKMSCRRVRQNH